MSAAHRRIVVRHANIRDDDYQGLLDFVEMYPSSVLVYNLDVAARQLAKLRSAMPEAEHYYAVKAAPIPQLIRRLAERGCRFDVASEAEMNLVLAQDVDASICLYTNPVVTPDVLRTALANGCRRFTFDCVEELEKYRDWAQDVDLLLRVATENAYTEMDLSKKFGCPINQVEPCLRRAAELGLRVVGLSFHVGSRTTRPDAYGRVTEVCADLLSQPGSGLRVLNIGGGFPVFHDGDDRELTFLRSIRSSLSRFGDCAEIITEPGRYIAEPSGTLLVSVRGVVKRNGRTWYYLDDGCYGTFSGLVFDYASYAISVFGDPGPLQQSVLAGPTCDSFDILSEDVMLPPLRVGDVIVVHHIGAYSLASATNFNGMSHAAVVAVDDEQDPVRAAFDGRAASAEPVFQAP